MSTTTKKPSPLAEAMLETAQGMHRIGIMDDAGLEKITARHFGVDAPPTEAPISADAIQ